VQKHILGKFVKDLGISHRSIVVDMVLQFQSTLGTNENQTLQITYKNPKENKTLVSESVSVAITFGIHVYPLLTV